MLAPALIKPPSVISHVTVHILNGMDDHVLSSRNSLISQSQFIFSYRKCFFFISVEDDPYLKWNEPGIGRYLFTMSFVGIVSFTVLLVKEYELINKVSRGGVFFYTFNNFLKIFEM